MLPSGLLAARRGRVYMVSVKQTNLEKLQLCKIHAVLIQRWADHSLMQLYPEHEENGNNSHNSVSIVEKL